MATQFEDSKVSNIELAGFRFMLLAWAFSVLIGLYAGYCYYRQGSAMDAYMELVNTPFKCQKIFREQIPECAEDTPWAKISCQYSLNQHCPAISRNDPDLTRLSEAYADWEADYEFYRGIPFVIFLLATLLFYGIRWGLTGRIKPLWLLPK